MSLHYRVKLEVLIVHVLPLSGHNLGAVSPCHHRYVRNLALCQVQKICSDSLPIRLLNFTGEKSAKIFDPICLWVGRISKWSDTSEVWNKLV